MAEHADSFHVRCDRIEHAIGWLEESRALGLVLQRHGALFTVFVPAHHVGGVLAANHFQLIFYEYLDGERVTARLFDGPRELAHLERSFEGTQAVRFDAKPWIKQGVIDRAGAKLLQRGLDAAWPTGLERHWVAEVLGLRDVAWASGEELMTRRAEFVARFPDSVLVQAGDEKLDAEVRVPRATPPAPTRTVERRILTPVPAIVLGTPVVEAPPVSPPVASPAAPTPPIPPLVVAPPPEPTPPPTAAPPTAPAPPTVATPPVAARRFEPPAPPPLAVLDALERELAPAEPPAAAPRPLPVDPSRPAVIPNLPLTDEFADDPPRATPQPVAAQPSRPAAIPNLPLTDEFASDTPPPPPRNARARAETGERRAVGLVLCSLSKQRRQLLEEDPSLVEPLLEARFEETIPGLLDLGTRARDLAEVLQAADPLAIEALRATTSRPVPGTRARVLDQRAVVRVAALLRKIDLDKVLAVPGMPRVAEDLRELIKLYTEAAQRGHAMLIATD